MDPAVFTWLAAALGWLLVMALAMYAAERERCRRYKREKDDADARAERLRGDLVVERARVRECWRRHGPPPRRQAPAGSDPGDSEFTAS